MDFREGDSVMHWTFGLGKVIRMEERSISGRDIMYYAIQIGDMTIWVPKDETLKDRLRPPTPEKEFKKLRKILSAQGEILPDDRMLRKTMLMGLLKDGSAESLCRVISALCTYRRSHSLNDNDQSLLKRAEKALIGEWGVAFSISPLQAESEMHNLLSAVLNEK